MVEKSIILILTLLLLLASQIQFLTVMSPTAAATATVGFTYTPATNTTAAICPGLTTNFDRWNYLSLPTHASDSAIESVLSTIDGKYDWIFTYDHTSGEFDYYFPAFETGDITTVTPGNCYIIKATENTTNFNYTNSTRFINISKNLTTNNGLWNYIGWVNNSVAIETGLSSIEDNYTWAFEYDNSVGAFEYYFPSFETGGLSTLNSCGCYIIKASNNVTLNYSI